MHLLKWVKGLAVAEFKRLLWANSCRNEQILENVSRKGVALSGTA